VKRPASVALRTTIAAACIEGAGGSASAPAGAPAPGRGEAILPRGAFRQQGLCPVYAPERSEDHREDEIACVTPFSAPC
jgi:hypothetical protein